MRDSADDSPRRGRSVRRGIEGANFFGYSLGHYYVFGEHRPGRTNVWQEYIERRNAVGYDPEAAAQALRDERLGAKQAAGDSTGLRGAIGTPDQVREYLLRYEEAGVDQVIFVMQAGRNRHEDIMEALELSDARWRRSSSSATSSHQRRRPRTGRPSANGARPQGARRARPRRLFVPALPDSGRPRRTVPNCRRWLERFRTTAPRGRTDTDLGILG